MIKTLIIVRHGQSERNNMMGENYAIDDKEALNNSLANHLTPLSKKGEDEAKAISKILKDLNLKYDSAIHSGMVRSRQTLGIIKKELEIDTVKTYQVPLVRERTNGYGYFLTKDEIDTHFPYLQDHFKLTGGFHSTPPGGESLIDASDRISIFLNGFFDGHYGDTVLVSCHGFAMRAMRFVLEEILIEGVDQIEYFSNCDFLQYEGTRGNMKLVQHYKTDNAKESTI